MKIILSLRRVLSRSRLGLSAISLTSLEFIITQTQSSTRIVTTNLSVLSNIQIDTLAIILFRSSWNICVAETICVYISLWYLLRVKHYHLSVRQWCPWICSRKRASFRPVLSQRSIKDFTRYCIRAELCALTGNVYQVCSSRFVFYRNFQ